MKIAAPHKTAGAQAQAASRMQQKATNAEPQQLTAMLHVNLLGETSCEQQEQVGSESKVGNVPDLSLLNLRISMSVPSTEAT